LLELGLMIFGADPMQVLGGGTDTFGVVVGVGVGVSL
jgi:hypothetical protein